jgi:16S rRNA (guanine966-N2)-methyltransferase
MKILTGSLKGKTLPFVPNPAMRPTADKVRMAVLNVLQGFVGGKRVLDLYSGTGALGFEALSQDAAFVRFVESHRPQARRIESAIEEWGLGARADVSAMDALKLIEKLGSRSDRYDLVFMDAPYKANLAAATLAALQESGLVEPHGYVVVECGKYESLPETMGGFGILRDRRYGQSRLVIYGRAAEKA